MRKKIKWIFFTVILLLLGSVSYYVYSFYKFGDEIYTAPEDSRFKHFYENQDPLQPVYTPPTWEGKERVNILLIGADARGISENEMPRSDSLMLLSVDPQTKRAHMLSVMRDAYVSIPGYGKTRINSALAYGGPELAMKTVSELLDMPVQYYIYADFEGFVALVDSIGGVEFEVEKDMHYTSRADGAEWDINLKAGQQMLDGKKALQYVRFRYDVMSDYARTERQRNLMKAIVQKMQSTTSLLKLPQILESIEPYIETNLTIGRMIRLGTLAFEVDTNSIVTAQIPPSNLLRNEIIGGADVITFNVQSVQKAVAELLTQVPESDPTEATDNNTKTDGLSAQ